MARFSRMLAVFVAMGCLCIALGLGGATWSVRQGLVRPPTGVMRLGDFELMAFHGIDFSTMRSPRGYYTIWIALRSTSSAPPQPWHPLVWARRLVKLEVPPASAR
ncbi:MAG TPA: hypothetical protein VFU22_24450 [Roseiflexaceae bacterium]|nr:hypothetical protein [Roseiflexaceae bacterium]